jgi:UDP-N-acetylmuramate--alanine ligase
MLALNDIKRVYFVGLGGIGMSALARFFMRRGVVVCGYDRTETELTKTLVAEGMQCHYIDDVHLLDKAADAVIYTPAIPAQHTELLYYQQNGYEVMKRSDMHYKQAIACALRSRYTWQNYCKHHACTFAARYRLRM